MAEKEIGIRYKSDVSAVIVSCESVLIYKMQLGICLCIRLPILIKGVNTGGFR